MKGAVDKTHGAAHFTEDRGGGGAPGWLRLHRRRSQPPALQPHARTAGGELPRGGAGAGASAAVSHLLMDFGIELADLG